MSVRLEVSARGGIMKTAGNALNCNFQCIILHNERKVTKKIRNFALMNLPSDPIMLYSAVNMKLRDQYATLAALCDDLDISEDDLRGRLSAAGFTYSPTLNQFR